MAKTRIIECCVCNGEFEIVEPGEGYDGRDPRKMPETVTRTYPCPHCGKWNRLTWKVVEVEEEELNGNSGV